MYTSLQMTKPVPVEPKVVSVTIALTPLEALGVLRGIRNYISPAYGGRTYPELINLGSALASYETRLLHTN